jgi:hypothetical protein
MEKDPNRGREKGSDATTNERTDEVFWKGERERTKDTDSLVLAHVDAITDD